MTHIRLPAYYILLTSLFILLSLPINAQYVEITGVPFQFRQNPDAVVSMAQDLRGYIWIADIGTGLYRYDGSSMVHYRSDPDDENTLSSNRMECVYADEQGMIWIGTFTNGLNKYDPDTDKFTRYTHNPKDPLSIRSNALRSLTMDKEGMLWIGTLTGVDKLDPRTGVFTHIHTDDPDEELLSKEHIRAMYVDNSGTLWIGSSSPFPGEKSIGGLFRFDIKTAEITHYVYSEEDKNSLINNNVRAIYEDSQGNFWVGTAGDGLHTMDRDKGTFTRHLYDPSNPERLSRAPLSPVINGAPDHITFINEDAAGGIWIGTFTGGASRWDPFNKKIIHYSPENSGENHIANNSFWSSLKTYDNLLWFGTWIPQSIDDILLKVKNIKLDITHRDLPLAPTIYTFEESVKGQLYIGSVNGLWQEQANGELVNLISLTPENVLFPGVQDMILDNDDQIWAATGQGLYHYNVKTGSKEIFLHDPNDRQTISSSTVTEVYKISDDKMLVGSIIGLDLLDSHTRKFKRLGFYNSDSIEERISVNDIQMDFDGNIWVGTMGHGIKRIDPESGTWESYDMEAGSEYVMSLFVDSKGRIWLGTDSNGLYVYDKESDQFTIFRDRYSYLPYSSIQGIIEDESGALWVLKGTDLVQFYPETKESRSIARSRGINFGSTRGGFHHSDDGEILIGTNMGYYHFKPTDLLIQELESHEPFINKMYLNDELVLPGEQDILTKHISLTEELSLAYDENTFSFEIGYINYFTELGDARIQHKLEGLDNKWRNTELGDLITYFKVPQGKYTLHIKALDINGKTQTKSLNIQILHPWWTSQLAYWMYAIIFISGVWLIHRFQKARTIRIEREKTRERELAHAKEIEKAYTELKTTQAQLVHAEKMASLGELTAGIAHEIQNPLNFVNNFSELNEELLEELQQELKQGDLEEAFTISSNLIENEQKIKHHGKRADSIIKNMLLHSRTGESRKESININELCDEYMRLAYHGLRGKEKSFNASFETDFDDSIPPIQVIPQDIGRVLLNLINNAFYAVHEKAKQNNDPEYKPLLKLKSILNPSAEADGNVETFIQITIADNGPGIPNDILEKIFQPFFTTKPTGQGTGLGLSMSYDIIKAHGGELLVESNIGQGTIFKVILKV